MKIILTLFALAAPAFAQSTIDPVQPYTWGVNVGWLNARPSAAYGFRTGDTVCSGFIWAESVGWLNLGSGSPANGRAYTNTAGEWGVNILPDGKLRGYAWGANIGWLNFETHGNPRIDLLSGIFSGFAWSPNAGWLSFGDAAFHATATTLAITDSDGDGISDAWELEAAGNLTTLGALADADGDGVSDFDEYLADTDPLDGSDRLHITRYESIILAGGPGTTQNLEFTSHSTRLYRVETRLALDSGVWADAGLGLFIGSPGTTLLDLGAPADAQRFYRVTAQRPLAP